MGNTIFQTMLLCFRIYNYYVRDHNTQCHLNNDSFKSLLYFAILYFANHINKYVLLPTIMWLHMSQKWGFLKMCSRKVCALGSIWRGARDGEQIVMGRLPGMTVGSGGGGGGKDMAGGVETDTPMVLRWPVLLLTSESSSVWNFTSSMGRWKKLSALLLRRLLVLKESERFSLCSWKKHGKTEM